MAFTYRGLTAELRRHTVTPAEVDQQLERLRQQNPRIALVEDRPAQLGDEVVLDYAGYCDGVQFPGGTAENQTLVLGSGTFIPGFEEQLVDRVPGEDVTVHVTFPAAYHAPELAGKQAEFRCKLRQIRLKTVYQLDDTFAKEVGRCDSLEEMRQKLTDSLQSYSDQRGEQDLQERLLDQAAQTLEFAPSEDQIRQEMDAQMETLKAQLANQGLTLEMYCQFLNTTPEALRQDTRENAVASVKVQAAVEQIVYLENLEATQEEMGQTIAAVARQNHMTVEELKPYCDGEFTAAVVRSILTGKVMALIRETAQVTQVAEG